MKKSIDCGCYFNSKKHKLVSEKKNSINIKLFLSSTIYIQQGNSKNNFYII